MKEVTFLRYQTEFGLKFGMSFSTLVFHASFFLQPQCVPPDSSASLAKMLAFIKDHPELEAVVYPDEEQPLYVLQMNDTYTQVVMDKVRDANNISRDVLFLGTCECAVHGSG